MVKREGEDIVVERTQTGVRIEKRLLKVLKALADYYDISLGDLLEGIVLHAFDGKSPFEKKSLQRIADLNASTGSISTRAPAIACETRNERRRRGRRAGRRVRGLHAAAGEFHHRQHLQAAWWILREAPSLPGMRRFVEGLRRYAAHIGKPDLYHATITLGVPAPCRRAARASGARALVGRVRARPSGAVRAELSAATRRRRRSLRRWPSASSSSPTRAAPGLDQLADLAEPERRHVDVDVLVVAGCTQ